MNLPTDPKKADRDSIDSMEIDEVKGKVTDKTGDGADSIMTDLGTSTP